MELDRALELAVVSSWEDLLKPDGTCSVVFNIRRNRILPLDSLEVWTLRNRGYRGMQSRALSADHLGGRDSERPPESTTASALSTGLAFSANCASFFCLRRSAFSRCFSCLFISF